MKTHVLILTAFFCSFLLISCNSEPSLQKYFVEHSEDANFINLDISPSILNVTKDSLDTNELKALKSFKKMNILAFKLDSTNSTFFQTEKNKVDQILKAEKFNVLMKVGSGKQGVSVSYIGTDKKVDEIIVYAKSPEAGFAIARILGDKMTPTDVMNFISILQKSNINLEQLKPLQDAMQKK